MPPALLRTPPAALSVGPPTDPTAPAPQSKSPDTATRTILDRVTMIHVWPKNRPCTTRVTAQPPVPKIPLGFDPLRAAIQFQTRLAERIKTNRVVYSPGIEARRAH